VLDELLIAGHEKLKGSFLTTLKEFLSETKTIKV
jgi:hypothetical protein